MEYTDNKPVCVIAATNRPDALDPALRRAGRFDREIAIGSPDENARAHILGVLTKKLRVSGDFDFKALAKATPGFVGADLQVDYLINTCFFFEPVLFFIFIIIFFLGIDSRGSQLCRQADLSRHPRQWRWDGNGDLDNNERRGSRIVFIFGSCGNIIGHWKPSRL